MAGHNGVSSKQHDPNVRAERASTDACAVHAHNPPDLRAERTTESKTAETAFQDWSSAPPTERPLAAQRPTLAKVLFEVLKEHAVSRSRFADMIGVNEKQVRKMLDGRSPIPMATLGVMPLDMAIDFMSRVTRGRHGAVVEASSLLRLGLEGLRRHVEVGNTKDVRRHVRDAQRALLELDARLDEERT